MLVYLQNLILEMVARGEELRATTDRLCREVERLAPGTTCSILAVDSDGVLHPVAGPSLPQTYNDAIDGLKISACAGSCGTAAFHRRQVTVTDIETDPLWADYKALALPLGLKACWSSPIVSSGRVVGTFAFYYRERRGPTDFERDIVAKSLQLCQIAFERDHRLRINERLLYTDTLTDLHNRACFEQALIEPSHGGSALLLIDIDDLKLVNDTFGHGTGDSLIRIIARRLADAAAPHRAFRVGGDELAVLAETGEVVPLAQRILEALRAPADCGGHVLVPSITIGAAIRSIDDKSGTVMRQNADLALYHGKEDGGRGTLVLYAPELRTRMNRRLRAIDQLRRAIAEDRIEARYQPIARLDNGEVLSFEALARIRERDGTIVPACEFHEAFADARNAAEVTRIMLRAVASDLRLWMDAGVAIGRIAVNLAPADFAHGRLVEDVQAIFAAAGAPLDRLTLEITESVYLSRRDQMVQRQMEALRRLGVKLALDDFGTGYASLTHLLFTPVDTLKIDKSFVDHLTDDGEAGGAAVINGLMRIAEKLGMDVVAEGVESVDQRERLVALGCKLGQGHLFAAALDREAVGVLLRTTPTCLPETPLPSSLRARRIRRRDRKDAA
ncbi:MAG TPA: EAL domain-containing protein [Sphingomonas sp.]|uniref:putative bifunctional diguanylate cyclase/phosphodiesterase n=1 Tax=Sphingomonas sp. TaxID=28214 RepID=UPI002C3AE3BD|nr:EAL domain-containing protein [Sphingomonas sp.]HMI19854.1 EAL domain-containing protein [Sphingomonas sp.]